MSCDNTEFKTVGQKRFSYSNTFICNENALINTIYAHPSPCSRKIKVGMKIVNITLATSIR